MTGDCCVLNSCGVVYTEIQSETSVFKFLWCCVDGSLNEG